MNVAKYEKLGLKTDVAKKKKKLIKSPRWMAGQHRMGVINSFLLKKIMKRDQRIYGCFWSAKMTLPNHLTL